MATTREVLALPELHEGLLEAWEVRRLAAARLPERRADALAARLLVRLCAARFTGLPVTGAAPAQWCPDCARHGHGRPYLPGRPGTGVSLSHADGVVAAAVGPGPIGVDVEPAARRPGSVRVLRRLLPEAELRAATALPDPGPELLRLWVRREALFKAGADVSPSGTTGGGAGDGRDRSAGGGSAGSRDGLVGRGRTVGPDRSAGGGSPSGPLRSAGDGRTGGQDRPSRDGSTDCPDPFGFGSRSVLRVLEWTDDRRAAVAAVAGTGPVTVLAGLGPLVP
ncbi:4'-phosphopantetheinyl transferase family protein [Streptomyces sp. NPDC092359]|uniref:4'-phosphopantetheinyl transferase family protein n=1 Tax=Streptomyces sp. NPDC092359 TaxID=3366014 RepID=UPI0038278ADD